MADNKVIMNLKVTEQQRYQYRLLALHLGVSFSEMVRKFVDDAYEIYEYQIERESEK